MATLPGAAVQSPTVSWLERLRTLARPRRVADHNNAMPDRPLNVLVLCTGNAARSILGEALLNRLGRGRIRGHSAGSQPAGRVNPLALRVLAENGIPTPKFYSKSWTEFAAAGRPPMDIVITVCDSAADETCPWLPGAALRAHWGLNDPATVQGPEHERLQAFRQAFAALKTRVEKLAALAERRPDREIFEAELARIQGGP